MRVDTFLLVAVFAALPTALIAAKTPPAPMDYQAPVYPESLLDSGKDGLAKITFTVNERGLVEDPVVAEASEPEFGESALAAVREWRFRPGTEDDVAVSMKVSLPFQFTASPENKINAALHPKVFKVIDETIVPAKDLDSRPVVATRKRVPYPEALKGSGTEERVTLPVVIGPDGLIYNPEVIKFTVKEFYVPALVTAAQWTFEPPMKDGKPAYAQFELTIWVMEGDAPTGRGETGRKAPPPPK